MSRSHLREGNRRVGFRRLGRNLFARGQVVAVRGIDEMARILQAGSDFATEGEERAAAELSRLPANWTVIANKMLVTKNGRSFEVDFIVIGDRLVHLIDEKGWG